MDLVKRIKVFILIIVTPILLIWIFQQKLIVLTGQTMGTTYSVKMYTSSWRNKSDIKKQIETRLQKINSTFSTWDESSELSQFNKSKILEPIRVAFISISSGSFSS